MSSTDVVRARIDKQIKSEASAALAEMGLSMSDAIRLLMVRIAQDKALPFQVRTPNATTVATFAATDRGQDLVRCQNEDELFDRLDL